MRLYDLIVVTAYRLKNTNLELENDLLEETRILPLNSIIEETEFSQGVLRNKTVELSEEVP